MKTLNFSISDFTSLQKKLLNEFEFEETSFNFLESINKKNESFFRRVFIESGLEAWIFEAKFDENIVFKQESTNQHYGATHFFNFGGILSATDLFRNQPLSKGIFEVRADVNLNFEVKANEHIYCISFIYSSRWLEINLLKIPNLKNLYGEGFFIRKFDFNEPLQIQQLKLIQISKNSIYDGFLLKINIFRLLGIYFDTIIDISPTFEKNKITLNQMIGHIEEILSNDFEIVIPKIYKIVENNGFTKNNFIVNFKSKHQLNVFDYRQLKKVELASKLLIEGYSVIETAKKVGFVKSSRFITFFTKAYGLTPKKYIKKHKILE